MLTLAGEQGRMWRKWMETDWIVEKPEEGCIHNDATINNNPH